MSVKAYQAALGVTADGIRGPKTIAAVKAFQAAHGLVVDGIVGPKTAAALGGGGGGEAPAAAPAAPAIDSTLLAQNYGFAMAVLNSDASLRHLFDVAVAETWTPERFQAGLRATPWYQQHSEQWRNAEILKASDPASYATSLAQVQTRVSIMAGDMGAYINTAGTQLLGEQAYTLGWDDNQLRQTLATYVQYTDGRMLGQAGQWDTQLREYAQNMGIDLPASTFASYVQEASSGLRTVDDQKNKIREMSVSAFPHLADRLRAGETVQDIASPYEQAMASTLELNPQSLTLTDPTIRKAIASADAQGQPVLRTLYDFQTDLRKDTRWLKTQNAQDAAIGTTHKILSDFGLIS